MRIYKKTPSDRLRATCVYIKKYIINRGARVRAYIKNVLFRVPRGHLGRLVFSGNRPPPALSGPLRACLPSGGGSLPGCRSQLATLPGIGSRAPDSAGRFRWVRSRSRLPGLSSVDPVRLSAGDLLPVLCRGSVRAVGPGDPGGPAPPWICCRLWIGSPFRAGCLPGVWWICRRCRRAWRAYSRFCAFRVYLCGLRA